MAQRDNILQELNELNSRLTASQPENVYTVPAGYFDQLAVQVLNKIRAMEAANAADELAHLSPVLSGLSKEMPYAVPAGYFDALGEGIMQAIRNGNDYVSAREETEAISPLLGSLNKEMPFSVPAGYFENLAVDIAAKESKTEAKVISLTGSRKWFRYAAAAVVTGLVVLAGFLLIDRNERKEAGELALNKVTKDVKKLNDIQKDELIDFLDINGTETAQVSIPNKPKEIQQLLQDVSDEELKDFQEQTEDIEEVLITN